MFHELRKTQMTFSPQVIQELLAASKEQRQALTTGYEQLPNTCCRRRAECCSLLPEMNLLEALAAIQFLLNQSPSDRHQLNKRLIRYFFLNPVEMLSCPFLQGENCLVYQDRFFGCRAYGLWSPRYYEEQAALSRQAKQQNQEQWQRLGVSLPKEVVEFQLPYCTFVAVEGDKPVDDTQILHTSDTIEALSGQLSPWHDSFRMNCFSDLSFLLASLAFGVPEAVELKFGLVRDFLATGTKQKLEQILEKLPDLLAA
jgi:Fe-S-cluster containining protein